MDEQPVRRILREQGGVVARFQLEAVGARKHDIERMLRRRDLVRVLPGVYVSHTGEPTRRQVEAAAVLRYWPAALGAFSAVDLKNWRRPPHLIVEKRRTLIATSGVVINHCDHFEEYVRARPFPPRQRIEQAALDAAVRLARPDHVFTILADVLQSRRTTVRRLDLALMGRRRIPRRDLLGAVIADLGSGATSVLEREWLTLERRHGLPTGQRQAAFRVEGLGGLRDVLYPASGLVVELDGRPFHDTAAARGADARRDLMAAAEGLLTVRLTYGQVFHEPCATVARVAELLGRRGWSGGLRRCPGC